MRMRKEDVDTYAGLAAYVKDDLPQVTTVPGIRSAFKKYAGMDLSDLTIALGWDYDPELRVGPKFEFSRFFIQLNKALVEKFQGNEDLSTGRSGRVHLAGVVILACLIGWRIGARTLGHYSSEDVAPKMFGFIKSVYGETVLTDITTVTGL